MFPKLVLQLTNWNALISQLVTSVNQIITRTSHFLISGIPLISHPLFICLLQVPKHDPSISFGCSASHLFSSHWFVGGATSCVLQDGQHLAVCFFTCPLIYSPSLKTCSYPERLDQIQVQMWIFPCAVYFAMPSEGSFLVSSHCWVLNSVNLMKEIWYFFIFWHKIMQAYLVYFLPHIFFKGPWSFQYEMFRDHN